MTAREQLLLAGLGGAVLLWAFSRTRAGESAVASTVEYAGSVAQDVIAEASAVLGALTRGERNNNPGNIERAGDRWQGMSIDQSGDPRFVVFDDPLYGLRALSRVLLTKSRQGLRTVVQIVSSWAPPPENNTAAYISAVAEDLEVAANQVLDLNDPAQLAALSAAIVQHENGRNIYGPLVEQAARMAYA